MVSIVVKFVVEEVSFWSRYFAGFVHIMPIALSFTYILLELISIFRLCMFMCGCIVLLKLVHIPQINLPVTSNITHSPVQYINFNEKIGNEGLSIMLSRKGVSLDKVAEISKKIEEFIPSSWLYSARISAKIIECNGLCQLSDCYISGFGFKLHIKEDHGNIIIRSVQKNKKEILKGDFMNVSRKTPNSIMKEIMVFLSKTGYKSNNISKISVGYTTSNKEMPKIDFVNFSNKNGKNQSVVRIGNKFYNPSEKYSYNDLVIVKKPVNKRISSRYGWRMHPVLKVRKMHTGIDYAAPLGTPIYATAGGKITKSKFCAGYGNYIEVSHDAHNKTIKTGYAHLTKLLLKQNQVIKQGDLIGYAGNTGRVTSAHLHYEVKIDGKFVNPDSLKSYYKKMPDDELRTVNKCYEVYKSLGAFR